MAKRSNTRTNRTTTTDKSKSDHIRECFGANPEGTAAQCAKALAEKGVEVGSGHCQQILNKRRGGGSSSKVDVAQIKLAAEFVAANEGVDVLLLREIPLHPLLVLLAPLLLEPHDDIGAESLIHRKSTDWIRSGIPSNWIHKSA
jgi:hypothetical protein